MSEIEKKTDGLNENDVLAKPKRAVQSLLFPVEDAEIPDKKKRVKTDRVEKTSKNEAKTEQAECQLEMFRREMRNICQEEMGVKKEVNGRNMTIAVCAAVFLTFLLLYTASMALNNMRYIGGLTEEVRNMQSTFSRQVQMVDKKIGELYAPTRPTQNMPRKRMNDKIGSHDSSKDGVLFRGVKGTDVPGFPEKYDGRDTDNMTLRGPMAAEPNAMNTDMVRQEDTRKAEKQVIATEMNQVLAGITYEMYANNTFENRLKILSTHFLTNTVLMEYMLRTMAINSGVLNVQKTEEEINSNLKAILETEAGKKMFAIYSLWQMAAKDPEILAEVDAKLINNRFYGLSFIPAVENALLK